jgi:restriction endonuclease S subunit
MSKWPIEKLDKHIIESKEQYGSEKLNGIQVLSVTNDQGFVNSDKRTSDNVSNYKIIKNGYFAYNPYRINVGSLAFAGDKYSGIVSPAYVVFSCSDDLDPEYLWRYLKSDVGLFHIRQGGKGSVRSSLSFEKLQEIEIPLPPLPEQKRIVKKIKEIEEKIGFTQSKIRKESMILDSIFPSLYNSLIKKEESENSTVSLGKIIKRYKKEILIKDNIEYKRITIRTNNLGISMRDSLLGEKIGTKKQFMVKADQLLLSKIDARNGAFGIVPKDLDGAIITGNFWAYDINDALVDNEFIRQFVQTESFSEFCKRSSSGATNRRYLDETIFLNQLIVLPNKKTQDQICSMGLLSQSFKKNRNNQNKILNFLIPSVLAKAFNGDL